MDILRSFAPPATSIEICTSDGFQLNNEIEIEDGSGLMLVGGEGFTWRPWTMTGGKLVNQKGQFDIAESGWGLLALVWPKPGELVYSMSWKTTLTV